MSAPTHMEPEQSDADELSVVLLGQIDRLFAQHVTKERLYAAEDGAWQADIWDAVMEAGLPLALVPEQQGGYGLKPADALLLVRRAAYYTTPLPLGEAMLASAFWASASGEPPDGIVTLASGLRASPPTLSSVAGGYRVEGTLERVPWGKDADHVLVWANDQNGAAHLALIPRSEGEVRHRRNVAFEPRPTIVLSGNVLPDELVRPAPPWLKEGVLPFGALLRAVQMVGAMERSLEYALAHANERSQFGRVLSKFQAIQHMLADAAGEFAASAATADGAAEAWGHPDFVLAAAFAKARVGEAAGKVAAICHQVHGAMGFTHEHPLHLATRRLWSWRDEFGAEPLWQEMIGRRICAGGGEALWDTLVRVTHNTAGRQGIE
jgi:acyl-CoA dehydrogenase